MTNLAQHLRNRRVDPRGHEFRPTCEKHSHTKRHMSVVTTITHMAPNCHTTVAHVAPGGHKYGPTWSQESSQTVTHIAPNNHQSSLVATNCEILRLHFWRNTVWRNTHVHTQHDASERASRSTHRRRHSGHHPFSIFFSQNTPRCNKRVSWSAGVTACVVWQAAFANNIIGHRIGRPCKYHTYQRGEGDTASRGLTPSELTLAPICV